MFEKTLIPVAHGETSEELRKIGRILKSLGSESICLFHVSDADSFFNGSDMSWLLLLKEAIEELGLSVDVRTGSDHIASSIAEAALREGVDEIYLKAKRHWQLRTILLGSVSRDLLRLADTPVFVHKIRPLLPKEKEGTITRDDLIILYATDFDKASNRPLPYVMQFQGSWCHILHVRGRRADPRSEKRKSSRVKEKLTSLEEELRPYYGRVTSEERIGNPANEVLFVSDQIHADVIVLGRSRPAFLSSPMGDTAEQIVTGSKASIFLVP
ncbi:MAG: UspA domain protein [Methanomicrobiales archaeon 53_19]|jgi:nucleotide-binding universal stress UspA family protein|uniref:universal stress protein n=1 Tax=Methanocalculus sp. TaxID=2004547 RepID=UPI0007461055|nr:universal stress protein [Methanocalculus sp.]KUK70495.1 MAG: UspA domain protein [Methanocalculus sp. 52_23]KUL03584.1 MAG: UspA domain protein [Methanomicrobiales archaeon 53_19]HIJ06404.1 universal stress protein [Methanocalculus sp.]